MRFRAQKKPECSRNVVKELKRNTMSSIYIKNNLDRYRRTTP